MDVIERGRIEDARPRRKPLFKKLSPGSQKAEAKRRARREKDFERRGRNIYKFRKRGRYGR